VNGDSIFLDKAFTSLPVESQFLAPRLQDSIREKSGQDNVNVIPAKDHQFDCIPQQLQEFGYIVLPSPLPISLLNDLFSHFKSLDESVFKQGGIGRKVSYQVNTQVRRDEIHWLTPNHPITRTYLDWMELLRLELNRCLYLGLFEYECHYACYPVGGFYKKHWDAFKGGRNRVISTVLYLNPNWKPHDGGELYLYSSQDENELLEIITPEYGKLVMFLSEDFPHEVKPVFHPRYSVAGWFRVRPLQAVKVIPQ
jgi:SM-20-related protein